METRASAAPVIVVLGATGGIGSEICRRLAAAGARLVLAARDPRPLADLAAELGGLHRAMDARRVEEVEALFAVAMTEHGRVDGAVNAVGSVFLKPAHATSEQEWADTLATNLTSAFATVRAAAPAMRATGGSIVLFSTVAARLGLPNHEAIAAAKAGVEGLARAAAATYAARGVRVNVVAPGLVRTPATARLTANEATRKASEQMVPLRRLGEPRDVASVVAWLLDPAQAWITGQVIGVDGGLGTVRA